MKDDSVLIKHILEACEKIGRYTENMTSQAFADDEKTLDAVVRELTIVGEAAAGLSEEFLEENAEIPLHYATGMRNRIVHEYWAVDTEIVWKTSQEDIPALKISLAEL